MDDEKFVFLTEILFLIDIFVFIFNNLINHRIYLKDAFKLKNRLKKQKLSNIT